MVHCFRYESDAVYQDAELCGANSDALTLDCRIVLPYKVALDELNSQARLSDSYNARKWVSPRRRAKA